jgi:DNA repair protein RecO
MKIKDEGIYLFSKKHGEKFLILQIFSKTYGLIKCLSRISKKNHLLINLDLISFELDYKDKDSFGFIKFYQKKINTIDNVFLNLIKASASELCMKLLPTWEENLVIYKSLHRLSQLFNLNNDLIVAEYVKWEFQFLGCLGYGLDVKKCSQTGSDNVYYISPKSGNSISYEVGRKYEKKLFKIPDCLKNNFSRFQISEIESCLKISGFFLQKISDTDKKYIFRNQLVNMVSKL